MTQILSCRLVLLTLWLGVVSICGTSALQSPVKTNLMNSTVDDRLLDSSNIFYGPKLQERINVQVRNSTTSIKRDKMLPYGSYRSMNTNRKFKVMSDNQPTVLNRVHQTTDGNLLPRQAAVSRPLQIVTQHYTLNFSKHSLISTINQAANYGRRDKWSQKPPKCESNLHLKNVKGIKGEAFNSSSSVSSRTSVIIFHNSSSVEVPLGRYKSFLKRNAPVLDKRWILFAYVHVTRFLRWSNTYFLRPKKKNLKIWHLNQTSIFQRKHLMTSSIRPEELHALLPPPCKARDFLIDKRSLSRARNVKRQTTGLSSLIIYILKTHLHLSLVSTYCSHVVPTWSKSEQEKILDLVRYRKSPKETEFLPSTQSPAVPANTQYLVLAKRHARQSPIQFSPTHVVTDDRYKSDSTDEDAPLLVNYPPLSISELAIQQANVMKGHQTPERQTSRGQSSKHAVKRSLFRNSRRGSRFGGLNEDESLPSSSSRDSYRLYVDSSSPLSPWATRTSYRQPVSLKVIVHLRLSRGYERVLESAIFSGIRDFQSLSPFLAPSGKLVTLKDDKPRDILQAFCADILQANTTAVFHLVNPFFHTRSWSSAQYVSNLLSTLHMPIITWGPEYIGTTDKKESELLQLNISPTLYHQAQAMLEVLRHYNWTHFCVVYTPVAGHDAFITAVRILVNDNNSNVGKSGFKYDIIDHVEVSNASNRTTTSKDLKILTRSEARIILLYCMEGDTLNILQEATDLGLMTDEYLWFLTFEAVNKNKQLNANNLPLGLLGIHYEYGEHEMEQAIKTAVAIWFRGLHQSIKGNVDSAGEPTGLPWSMPNLECQSSKSLVWEDGPTFYDIMRNVSFDNVAFNELGQLKIKDISIVNIQPPAVGEEDRKWRQVGRFTADGVQMRHITWPGETIHPPLGKPRRHLLRIVTREEPPFVEYRKLNQNGTCGHFSYICQVYERDENELRTSNTTVERCCTGLSIDFLHRLSQSLNFEFFLYEVEDYQWGSKNADGTWDGIVGELRSGRADMAVASMTIDEDRSSGIDFSVPYMETGITFIVAIRDGAISATAFLEPYDYPSWCLILLCSVHVTGASIFIFEWFSPYGLDHGRRLSSKHRFSLFRTFWLMWAMLFGAAVTTDTPRGVSSKFVSNIWALFALVFSASYTANLAAFMITKEEYYDISGMQDWRLQNPHALAPPFRFATIPNGTTESNIKKNNYRMFEYMKKYSQRSVEQAMEALKKQKLHAFIYDASVLEYQEGKDKDCKLITVGNWYATTGYGVGFPFKSPWLERVNNVILKLQSEGEMERLKEFWLAGACHTKRKKNSNNRGIGNGVSSTTLGILNFTSAFIFLAAGTGLAIMTFMLEYMYFWFGRKRLSSWDKKGCCALISLSMGMSLSFQKSVHEAWDMHRRSKQKCTSPACETSLWKANHELRLARSEISRLQSELARATVEGSNSIVWKYDPISTAKPENQNKWDYDNNVPDDRDEEETVRVTLL